MSTTGSLTSYKISSTIRDVKQLHSFLLTNLGIIGIPFYSVTYDANTATVTVNTKEISPSTSTENIIQDLVVNKYPDPEVNPLADMQTITSDAGISQSVYGYFLQTVSVDGDAIISKNTSITRNMYYKNLEVKSGVTLNANGWRIVVSGTLTLNGTISNDGTDAVTTTAGVGTASIYSTYLGAGTSGGAGLSANGNGFPGFSASYQCAGGGGGAGGFSGSIYTGGAGGETISISPVDGGIQALATMPIAFLGRLVSNNFYIMGGTGGGGGGCNKGTASTVRSGAGGGAGGFIVLAARTIIGNGMLSARGGNGSSASWSGTATQVPGGMGGGGGGGGGCIVVITQGLVPSTISFNVTGGSGGAGVAPGAPGQPGANGNIFIINV